MIRLATAAILALSVHIVLFSIEIPSSDPTLMAPQSRAVSIDLVTFEKPVEKKAPPKSRVIKPQPKPTPKPKPIPVVPSPPAPPPVQPEPLSESIEAVPSMETKMEAQEAMAEPDAHTTEEDWTDEADDRAVVRTSVPRYDLNPPPHYPRVARRRNYQGIVILDVRVKVDGQVAQVRVAESSGYPILDRSAEKSVKGWHFTPATRGGRPIEMWVQVPVRYALQ